MTKKGLYALIMTTFLAGHVYLIYYLMQGELWLGGSICPLKLSTGLPCPSCGSTRAVLALLSGHLKEAFIINPMGILTYFLGCLAALTILSDWLTGRSVLFQKFQWAERKLLVKPYAYFFIVLIMMNWIWNITKGI